MRRVYVSEDVNGILTEYLAGRGYEISLVRRSEAVYPEVAAHPDIFMCKLGAEPEAPVFRGSVEKLGYRYPEDIRYNACVVGKYIIHNMKYTDPDLFAAAKAYIKSKGNDPECINVSQGYAKCNIIVVDDCHIITADAGIAAAVRKHGASCDVLEVAKGQVALPGFDYGFIGGASGRVGRSIVFNGNLEAHSDFAAIRDVIEKCGVELVYFKEYPLTDTGSIIEED